MNVIVKYLFLCFLIITIVDTPKKEKKRICSKFIDKTKERDWRLADPIHFHNANESDNEVTVKTLWDMDSIYFLFDVVDFYLRAFQTEKDHAKLYLDDMVEILLDTKNDKTECWAADDIVYHINLLGQKKDDRGSDSCITDPAWDGNARYTINIYGTLNDTTDIDKGFQVEMALPWSELDLQPSENLEIGINFANGDNDGNGRQLFGWVGIDTMRSPHLFGTLILIK
jgi:hypothetical protein